MKLTQKKIIISNILIISLYITTPQAEVLVSGENGEYNIYADGFKFTEPNREKISERSDGFASETNDKVSRSLPSNEVLVAIQKTALRYGSSPALRKVNLSVRDWTRLFQANIEIESGYKINAISPDGAYGLGQLMPKTASELGVDRLDYNQNLDGSARYLLAQIELFGNIKLAVAAYNAGPGAVTEHGGIPPFQETINHVRKVIHVYEQL